MSAHKPESSSRQADFQDILDQASKETIHRAQVRAEIETAVAQVPKKRGVAIALALSVPVLAILLAVNVFGLALLALFTPSPSPAVARRQTQEALDAMVRGIEGFREDYEELPERLIEVASPSEGQWTYSRQPNGQYRLVVAMHGQVLTFDSVQSKPVIK